MFASAQSRIPSELTVAPGQKKEGPWTGTPTLSDWVEASEEGSILLRREPASQALGRRFSIICESPLTGEEQDRTQSRWLPESSMKV